MGILKKIYMFVNIIEQSNPALRMGYVGDISVIAGYTKSMIMLGLLYWCLWTGCNSSWWQGLFLVPLYKFCLLMTSIYDGALLIDGISCTLCV